MNTFSVESRVSQVKCNQIFVLFHELSDVPQGVLLSDLLHLSKFYPNFRLLFLRRVIRYWIAFFVLRDCNFC